MQTPAAMFIEEAMDLVKGRALDITLDELKEFHEANGVKVLGIPFPDGVPDVAKGYLLGLETARAILAQNLAAVQAGVEI